LLVGDAAALGFELKAEQPSVVQRHHVGKSGARSQAFVDCCFGRSAIAARKWVPRENPGRAANAQVVKYRPLNGLFGSSCTVATTHRFAPSAEERANRRAVPECGSGGGCSGPGSAPRQLRVAGVATFLFGAAVRLRLALFRFCLAAGNAFRRPVASWP